MSKSLTLIANPAAGGGSSIKQLPKVIKKLESLGFDVIAKQSKSIEDAHDLAVQASKDGRLVVAYGGDGLVGKIAGALSEFQGAMGVIPAGRGNDFARVLSIPKDSLAACELLLNGSPKLIDTGLANGVPFVGNAIIGYLSESSALGNEIKMPLLKGRFAYTYAGFRVLMSWKPQRFNLKIDGEDRSFSGFGVFVSNSGTHAGGQRMVPTADINDGFLDLLIIKDLSKLKFIKLILRSFKALPLPEYGVEVHKAKEVVVESDECSEEVYADGESIAKVPVTINCVPNAVSVIVPG